MKFPILPQIAKIHSICDIHTNNCTKGMKSGEIIAQTNYQKKINNFPTKCQKHYLQVKTQAKNWYASPLD